ncbi:hypothetical protein GCM10009819_11780 [Agromyces tropicus]|uniref:Uncharacterized protein n=1 Tax=Agromyces tropicus TaxID=555371 RepID=A0ABN2U6W7_9MICO
MTDKDDILGRFAAGEAGPPPAPRIVDGETAGGEPADEVADADEAHDTGDADETPGS